MRCVEGLATNGAQVSLLAMKTEKHGNREIRAGGTAASLAHYETVPVNTRINPFRMAGNLLFSAEPYDLLRFRSERYSEALRRLIAESDFDIIQCEGPLFRYYLEEIRKLDAEIPVIVASGYANDAAMAKPEEFGFSGSIRKPFNIQELSETVKMFAVQR